MGERALVTGAQGFVGRFLIAELLSANADIRILGVGRSKRSSAFTHDISLGETRIRAPLTSQLATAIADERFEYVACDVRNEGEICAIVEQFGPTQIFHMASGLRDDDPSDLFSTNVEGTLALVEAVTRSAPGACIVLGSSGSVYGEADVIPVTEDERCDPRDIYAASKLASEHVARIVTRGSRVRLSIARIFNIVGPGQDERHAVGRFASQVAAIASGNAEPEVITGDLSTTRDFIDVRDVARALVILARVGERDGLYNVASGEEKPISGILDILLRAASLDGSVRVTRRYTRAADVQRYFADISRLRLLGYTPSYSFERMVCDVFDYYRNLFV